MALQVSALRRQASAHFFICHALASGQLAAVEDKLRRLETLRAELARMTDACRGGVAGECRILETLADHSHGHCASPDHAAPDAVGAGPG